MLSRRQFFLFSQVSSQYLYFLDNHLHRFLYLLIGMQSTNSLETGGQAGALELIELGGWLVHPGEAPAGAAGADTVPSQELCW